jgi:type VI secretion system protein ImpG
VAAAFEPYRLLQEYFACPARFDFVELTELGEALARCKSERVELLIPLDRFDETLEHAVDASRFVLFATPVVNLFPRQCGSFTVASGQELRVSADPTRPLDYEVHSIARVAANGGNREGRLEMLQPMYAMLSDESGGALPRYVVRRRASPLPPRRSTGGRASYIGNDVFLGLVEPGTLRPAAGDYKLEIEALCTNRDLPLALGHGHGQGALGSAEFTTRAGVPADAVHCIVAPSAPTTPPTQGETLWRLLSHLAPNSRYLHDHNGGADALRELLELYASLGAPQHRRQVEGILGISSKPIIGPLPVPGPRSFARGIEVRLECEEQAFGRHGAFTLAAVLARLFAKHTSANSFAQTVLTTRERGEVHRFPAQLGLRPLV